MEKSKAIDAADKLIKSIILDILEDLERYRIDLEEGKYTEGCTGHTVRICEATVAEHGGFFSRADWVAKLNRKESKA